MAALKKFPVTAGAGANVEATTGSAAPETGIRQVPATAVAPPRQWRPTESELGILRVLWTRGPSTVREVHATLAGATGYTTVLKLMQIMAEKGLVERDEDQRAHVYRARLAQEHTQRQLLGDLLERAFGGSATGMVMQLLSSRAASADEIAELRKLLDDYEGRRA
ncbi:MAG TPA: BlaI/MecI/CopY family transcriptional regulator [Terriglobales bacterium]|nr:BlaI/MecI/CopY family transcriptional regulator [Terriglobales bacterium]